MANYGLNSSDLPSSSQPMYFSDGYDEGVVQGFRSQFDGDYYREPDNTVRGFSMASADMTHHTTLKGFTGYEEDVEVSRGITMGMGAGGSTDPFQHQEEFVYPEFLSQIGEKQDFEGPSFNPCTVFADEAPPKFTDEHVPPEVPKDPFYQLAITTFYVMLAAHMTPATIGNLILKFLHNEVNSSISKVRASKFWIKADVFVKSDGFVRYVMSTVKVRVYRAVDGTYAVEFMRRGGCSVVFHSVFQQALSHFKENMRVVGEVGDMTPPPPQLGFGVLPLPSLGPDNPFAPETNLEPILDMAAMTSQPAIQAEAAVALVEIAEQDVSRAASLCTEEVFQAVQHLLQCDLTEASFPTARLLRQLSHCDEAKAFFADTKLLDDLIRKVQATLRCALVSGEFARVLAVVAKRYARNFPPECAQKIRRRLMDAAEDVGQSEVRQSLVQAADALSGGYN